LGDEGGYSPNLLTNIDALELIREAIKKAGLSLNNEVAIGLDVAASVFFSKNKYRLHDFSYTLSGEKLLQFYLQLIKRFKLAYLEDAFAEDDWENWQNLTQKVGDSLMIVGDDLLTTNQKRISLAQTKGACNAVLIKPNQIGTVCETVAAIRLARQTDWKIVVSHRSGETNDDFIADFAVGVNAEMVKFGAPARGERVAKYNRLLKIEQELD
jgi:enolase